MSLEKFNLTGKTALVTGAGGLLGVEHAAALLECNAAVVLTDIDERALKAAKENLSCLFGKGRIFTRAMDVSDLSSVAAVATNLAENSLNVEILVNNAAIDPKVKYEGEVIETSRLETFDLESWNSQLSVGLTGAFICSQVFGSAMAKAKKGGVILNIASDLSVLSPDQRLYSKEGLPRDLQPVKPVTYSVIKSGLLGLTRYLATYWVCEGVRCNALSPGGVFDGQSEEFVLRIKNLIPMARMARRDEYRSALQFLCSDASAYMNGQNVVMDGGRSIW